MAAPLLVTPLLALCTLPLAGAADEDALSPSSSRPPLFDGTRGGFTMWFMAFTSFVAWRLTDCADLLDGTTPRPPAPGAAGHDPAETTRWDRLNKRLYGAIAQAMPDWLRTSIFNDHRNDGVGATNFLRDSFDAVDAADHAAHMARLQAHYIKARSDISEGDLRLQYDSMMVARAGIIRTGNAAPVDSALMAMFDNSLPIA